jgi:acyl-CoA thioester hydrolase
MPIARIRVRVPFVDVDSSMRIHYTAFLRYMEVAEHTLMRSIGFPYATSLQSLAFPRVHLECDFQGAIRYDDELDVTARVDRVGNSSWTVAFAAHAPNSAQTLATGNMTIVAMDPIAERATALPGELRAALTDTED